MENRQRSWRGRVNKLISQLQKKRGDAAEARFFAVLMTLLRTGFIRYFLYTNQRHIQILKKLDYIGIDFVVFKNNGTAITVQIKSSDAGLEKFKKKNLSGVKSIQISSWEDIEEIIRKTAEILFNGEITPEEIMRKVAVDIPDGAYDV